MHVTRIQKNKKSKRFQPYKSSLYNDGILGNYITYFKLELFILAYYGKEHCRTKYYGSLLSSYLL